MSRNTCLTIDNHFSFHMWVKIFAKHTKSVFIFKCAVFSILHHDIVRMVWGPGLTAFQGLFKWRKYFYTFFRAIKLISLNDVFTICMNVCMDSCTLDKLFLCMGCVEEPLHNFFGNRRLWWLVILKAGKVFKWFGNATQWVTQKNKGQGKVNFFYDDRLCNWLIFRVWIVFVLFCHKIDDNKDTLI